MNKDFFKDLFKPENKNTLNSIYMMFLIGVVLLIFSNSFSDKEDIDDKNDASLNTEISEYTTQNNVLINGENSIEKQLEDILSKVEGAGVVDVFITYASTEEKIIAQNIKTERNYNELGDDISYKQENEIIFIEEKDDAKPYILMEYSPKVEGVVVVAEGGDNALVKQSLHSGVQAIFGIDAHKIVILKMK